MEPTKTSGKEKNIDLIWYRIKRHKGATILSIMLALFFTYLLYYFVGRAYPDFRPFGKLFGKVSSQMHDQHYTFYSGEPGSVYNLIGQGVDVSSFKDGDSITNQPTEGGYDNAFKVSKDENSFAIVPKVVIDGQDEGIAKSVQVVTPLFTERMHIFYRKSLFGKQNTGGDNELQLSATTDTAFLRNFRDSVRNIYVSHAGNSTFILSSYVLALINKQINESPSIGKAAAAKPKYKEIHIPYREACTAMIESSSGKKKIKRENLIDIMFWVGADPTDNFKKILDQGNYGLISVDPSFVAALNLDYHLDLEVTNIPKEYYGEENTDDISTISTTAYLITSRQMSQDDMLSMVTEIDDNKEEIDESIIDTNPARNVNISANGPLDEFGFLNFFSTNYKDSKDLQWKDWLGMISFVIAMITFFFPLVKSIGSIKSVWLSWSYNKQIDQLITTGENENIKKELSEMNEKIADLYGDGEISETHYNALTKRISVHLPENTPSVVKPINRDDQDDDKKTA